MVVCPWCGTAYTVFQSNCSRCGGPIPAPKTPQVVVQEEELLTPPPPPRLISDGYRWKLMIADAWSAGGGIFTFMGLIFSILGLVLTIAVVTAFVGIPFLVLGMVFLGGGTYVLFWRYREAMKNVNILRNGQAVRGEVTEARSNYTVTVNGRNPLIIGYRYQVQGREYRSSLSTLNPLALDYKPGKAVCVLYLEEAPEYSSLYPHP